MSLAPALNLASQQHGALADQQLRALGIPARAQRSAMAQHLLQRVAPGIVVVAGPADTWFRRLHVGLLALRPGAFVSHEAAAALLGLDRSMPGRAEFTVPDPPWTTHRRHPSPHEHHDRPSRCLDGSGLSLRLSNPHDSRPCCFWSQTSSSRRSLGQFDTAAAVCSRRVDQRTAGARPTRRSPPRQAADRQRRRDSTRATLPHLDP